jgi:hypothetical protein
MTAPGSGAPRVISPRRPGTASHGRRTAALAAALHRPFIPWQHQAADLIEECDPATGLRTRDLVVMTEQRQTGKTELIKFVVTARCLLDGPSRRVWYTAQTGLYARDKWSELATMLCARDSPLAGYVAARWSKGDECLTFPNGSTFRPFPPNRDALHSKQTDLVIVDEAWRHDPERGRELMQAISPTQATRPGAQTILTSTMGTAASTWWHSWVDLGRAGDPAVSAYLEHGIGDDADPDDIDAVIAAHPAVGYLTTAAFIRRERGKLTRNEFARAYGNARTASDERYIDPGLWASAATLDPPAAGVRVALAGDIAADRSRSAIVAAAGGVAEVVDARPGTAWLAPRMLELIAAHRPAAVAVLKTGAAGTLWDTLHTAGVDLLPVTDTDYAAACVRLMDGLASGAVKYRRHLQLDAAADAAVPRPVGDGGWTWGRRASGAPICELVAATLAAWADAHRPTRPRPKVLA